MVRTDVPPLLSSYAADCRRPRLARAGSRSDDDAIFAGAQPPRRRKNLLRRGASPVDPKGRRPGVAAADFVVGSGRSTGAARHETPVRPGTANREPAPVFGQARSCFWPDLNLRDQRRLCLARRCRPSSSGWGLDLFGAARPRTRLRFYAERTQTMMCSPPPSRVIVQVLVRARFRVQDQIGTNGYRRSKGLSF